MIVHRLHNEALALLHELFDHIPVKQLPRLEWRKYRTTAGTAHLETWTISLGATVITDSDRLRDTLVHEYAHLLAVHRAGSRGRGHGPAWQQAMLDLGAAPEVFHRYSCTRNIKRQKVWYRCERCQFQFARSRRLRTGQAYIHRGCGGRIAFVTVEPAIGTPEAA